MKSLIFVLTLSLGLTGLAGCSSKETVRVSGDVTWEGSPVPHGDVLFIDNDPHVTPQGGKIVDGKFALECKPGQKRVQIHAFRLSDKKTPDGRPIGEMYIPDRYNTNSTLTANVTADGDNQFNFPLEP